MTVDNFMTKMHLQKVLQIVTLLLTVDILWLKLITGNGSMMLLKGVNCEVLLKFLCQFRTTLEVVEIMYG